MWGSQDKSKSKDNGGRSTSEEVKDKRMPVWGLIITDILLTGVFLCIFALYHHVIPRNIHSEALVVATVKEGNNSFAMPGNNEEATTLPSDPSITTSENETNLSENETNNSENKANISETEEDSPENKANSSENNVNSLDNNVDSSDSKTEIQITTSEHSTVSSGNDAIDKVRQQNPSIANMKSNDHGENSNTRNYGNTNTMDIASDLSVSESISSLKRDITAVNSYHSDTIDFVTNMIELGSGGDKITYYVSDIYVSNIKYLKTAFAYGEYGKNLRDRTLEIAQENNALLAISGDFYGNGETGLVIRNGVLYRDVMNDADLCVLFTDGTMKTYTPEEITLEELIDQGAWQAWTFGPGLLDGDGAILTSFNTTSYLNSTNPRCAIGYVEPGHYVFVVVDGRDPGYSKGVTLSELASLMVDAGCKVAYNLDGGKSASMVYEDEYVNIPCEGGRSISDIIYLEE